MEQLWQQWNKTISLPRPDNGTSINLRLEKLFASLPSDRAAVQILCRFHKILDSLDQWILSCLRTSELSHRIRTVTISPFSYDELKKRWLRSSHILVTSDYGDTHAIRVVEPPSLDEVKRALHGKQIPNWAVECVYGLTGGYPEAFECVMTNWLRREKSEFGPDDFRVAMGLAGRMLKRFVHYLDLPNETRYRDYVIDLYQQYNPDNAYDMLRYHPWDKILLSKEGLRAESVGRAAVNLALDEAIEKQHVQNLRQFTLDRASKMYRRRQYSLVLALLEKAEVAVENASLQILGSHARIMNELYGSDGGLADIDTNWYKIIKWLADSKEVLGRYMSHVRSPVQIEGRYQELEEMAESILKAQQVSSRVVDVLAGLYKGEADTINCKCAALLLLLKYEAARIVPGHSSACQLTLALPEQIFRVWAYWSVGLDYYHAPGDASSVWEIAQKNWPKSTELRCTKEGEQFTSFDAFAYFVLAYLYEQKPDSLCNAIEPDFRSLDKALGVWSSVRTPSAHAMCVCNAKRRRKYFALIERWLNSLISVCPESVFWDELLGLIQA